MRMFGDVNTCAEGTQSAQHKVMPQSSTGCRSSDGEPPGAATAFSVLIMAAAILRHVRHTPAAACTKRCTQCDALPHPVPYSNVLQAVPQAVLSVYLNDSNMLLMLAGEVGIDDALVMETREETGMLYMKQHLTSGVPVVVMTACRRGGH